ncbi:MAG: tetratricopeptide repeat protein [Candidatus Omnitrophica bacterium]|nr:tetratricopeptide repeat protein [Candidatus Omnitrophota bacterium]
MRKFPFQTLIFYLLLYGIFVLASDSQKIREGIQVRTLNNLIPRSYTGLIDLNLTGSPTPDDRTTELIRYYRKIVEYHPGFHDAYGVLAFCYYHAGEKNRALATLEQSPEALNYFWNAFHLALLQYELRRYDQSMATLYQLLKMNPQLSMLYVKNSPMILQPILREARAADSVAANLHQGYLDATRLLVKCHYLNQQYADALRISLRNTAASAEQRAYFLKYAGLSALKLGQTDQALAYFRESLEANPQQADVYESLSELFLTMNNPALVNQARQMRDRLEKEKPADLSEIFRPRIF